MQLATGKLEWGWSTVDSMIDSITDSMDIWQIGVEVVQRYEYLPTNAPNPTLLQTLPCCACRACHLATKNHSAASQAHATLVNQQARCLLCIAAKRPSCALLLRGVPQFLTICFCALQTWQNPDVQTHPWLLPSLLLAQGSCRHERCHGGRCRHQPVLRDSQ